MFSSMLIPGICLADDTFGNSISSSFCDIFCACWRDVSSNLVHHHGELLVQNGVLVKMQ
jgi:hypothetical protein